MSDRRTQLRTTAQAKPSRHPITRAHIEVVASRSVAVFGLAFGAQTVPVALDQQEYAQGIWFTLVGIGMFGMLVLAVFAAVLKRFVKTANLLVLGIFLVALITWPLGLAVPIWTASDRPWLWFLITVATAAAAIALPVWLATVYLLLAPLLYGIIRTSPFGGSVSPALAALDVLYAIILGGAVLIIITMLRGAAAAVDSAQATALGRYLNAVREHATEVERVQVDSIVHDSVLTTLLSAAKADTPDSRQLAATMARNAIGHLQQETTTPAINTGVVSSTSLALRIGSAAKTLSSSIDVREGNEGNSQLPAPVAEALYSATLQAMVNSLQHAGDGEGVVHWVSINFFAGGSLLIEVGDTGGGFSLFDVPVERLGLRISIIERVSNAGGVVKVDSVLGEGAAIRIRWPAPPPRAQSVLQEAEQS